MSAAFDDLLVIGAGKMGSALVDGWLQRGLDPGTVTLVDPLFADAQNGWQARGVHCLQALDAIETRQPDLILLAVKPQMMASVLAQLTRFDHGALVVVSIAAGTLLQQLRAHLPQATCVRCMPNTPASVGAGVTAIYAPGASPDIIAGVTGLMDSVGAVIRVDEEGDMDAVTAISGSGPAYVFHLVEALSEAALSLGLTQSDADMLARHTVIGAAQLLDQSQQTPGQLRENVTSPGGTTAAGLAVLRDGGQLTALMKATARAAFERSRALARSDG